MADVHRSKKKVQSCTIRTWTVRSTTQGKGETGKQALQCLMLFNKSGLEWQHFTLEITKSEEMEWL